MSSMANDDSVPVGEHEVLIEELRRTVDHLAEAQRLSHTGSFVWKPSNGEIVWSDETYRIFEVHRAEKPTLDLLMQRLHPQDRNFFQQVIDRALQSGTDFEHEYRLLWADGRVKYIHAKAHALQDASGDREYIGAVSDITERKMAEEKIRDNERELRTLIDVMPAFIGTAAPDGSVEFINQSFLEYTGFSREQGIGWGWESAVHPDDHDRVVATWRAGLAAGQPIEHELRCRRADGTYRWFQCRSHPLRDDRGNVLKWYLTLTNIDKLKSTENALQTREHSILGVIETLPSMVWSLSAAGEVTYANQRLLEYCGTTLEELTSDKWFSFIHPEDREGTAEEFARAMESRTSHRIVHRVRGADGVYRWFHTMGEPLRNLQGEVIHWFGINLDIDERKRAEEALQKNGRELRTLIDVMPAFVGTALPDGAVDFVSQSFLEYTGFSRERSMGWGWGDAVHPEDLDRVLANWRAGLEAVVPIEHEVRFRRTDGTYQWFLLRGLPLQDDGGNAIKWYATLTNIDALKQTTSKLQLREQELIGILETIPSLLWSASPTGEVTHISQRVIEYTGRSIEEFQHLGWKRIIHPDDFEDTAKAYFQAIQAGEPYCAKHRLRRRDGEYRWYYASGCPLRDSDGGIIQWYGLSIDIDEQKRAEDHLRDTSIKLAKASRLAAVAELAGSIAHEINQPLTSVLANAQAAKRWLGSAPPNVAEVDSSIERAIRDAHAADETIQHIRKLFKQESVDKKEVSLPDILREVVRLIHADTNKRQVPIEFHFEESLTMIHVDQVQIQQVFTNLIVNAIEALEGRQAAPQVLLRVVTDSREILIQVIDNGPGVHDTETIFDSFVTTKANGMGVGLAVSRSIVEAHGGRLWAENGKAGGAIFNVALPLSHAGLAKALI
jgi:PAS domain S-box-containing protein